MRLHSGLPQTFWADAVHIAVYLINYGPSVPLEFRLLEEVWRGKEVQLSHLKVFGCVSYVHIDSDARNKLDAKSKKCFFIGHGDKEFGFRFWDDQNRKIIRSRNVIFNEKVLYKDRSSVETDMADSDTNGGEPLTYKESLQDGNSSKWELAMKDEMSGCFDGLRSFMNPCLKEDYPLAEALRLAVLAKACVEEDPLQRPSMDDILKVLVRMVR
ncbi:hypothetical protein POTOM_033879 [Populus tomentosa]|uniref:Retroviral polymerase SH3-like domain-containing protein n=1 Tax=Populus tomentosa TaxID=118781 RepID=A0A8X8CNJ0_POPTO|nr:hypothetical protein POTOM_033879 [Populus tomentosa]